MSSYDDFTSDLVGTAIGMRTGESTTYTLRFSKLRLDEDYMLYDQETDQYIAIEEGTEYTFNAVPNCIVDDRFLIVEGNNSPTVATDIDNTETEIKIQKFVQDGQLFILKDGRLYNATGTLVR